MPIVSNDLTLITCDDHIFDELHYPLISAQIIWTETPWHDQGIQIL